MVLVSTGGARTTASLRGWFYRGTSCVAPILRHCAGDHRRRQESGRQESVNGQERPQRREPQGRVDGATGPRTAAATPAGQGQRTEYVPVRDTGDDRAGRWAPCHDSLQLESPTCMNIDIGTSEHPQDGPRSMSQVVNLHIVIYSLATTGRQAGLCGSLCYMPGCLDCCGPSGKPI